MKICRQPNILAYMKQWLLFYLGSGKTLLTQYHEFFKKKCDWSSPHFPLQNKTITAFYIDHAVLGFVLLAIARSCLLLHLDAASCFLGISWISSLSSLKVGCVFAEYTLKSMKLGWPGGTKQGWGWQELCRGTGLGSWGVWFLLVGYWWEHCHGLKRDEDLKALSEN